MEILQELLQGFVFGIMAIAIVYFVLLLIQLFNVLGGK